MTDLIVQNYNHPSIVCWGCQRDHSRRRRDPDMVENHKLLNDLCHKLDPLAPRRWPTPSCWIWTTPLVELADIRSYNLYFGWYLGELEQNDAWLDEFHQKHPEAVIGLSEYGADANPAYQNGHPEKGDWSEPYQAIYHEHMLKMWSERPTSGRCTAGICSTLRRWPQRGRQAGPEPEGAGHL